jgi:hypothetical protein
MNLLKNKNMKTILKLLSIITLLFLINGCKEKDCVGNDCPLPDGSFCPNNMINVNDNCSCPIGFIEFNQNCLEESTNNTGYLIDDLNCNCLLKAGFGLDENQNARIYIVTSSDTLDVLSTNYTGNPDNFSILLNYPAVKCNNLSSGSYPEFRGIVLNDTLNLSIFWRLPNNGMISIIDSCVGIKIPRL